MIIDGSWQLGMNVIRGLQQAYYNSRDLRLLWRYWVYNWVLLTLAIVLYPWISHGECKVHLETQFLRDHLSNSYT